MHISLIFTNRFCFIRTVYYSVFSVSRASSWKRSISYVNLLWLETLIVWSCLEDCTIQIKQLTGKVYIRGSTPLYQGKCAFKLWIQMNFVVFEDVFVCVTYTVNNSFHANHVYILHHKLQKRDYIYVNLYKRYCIGADIYFRNIQNHILENIL